MHRVAVAIVLLSPMLTGCFGDEPLAPVEDPPTWRVGEWFEYEVRDADGRFTSLFVVAPGVTNRERHFDHGYVPRSTYDGVFMHLDDDLTPLAPGWGDLLPFPIRDGKRYAATVDGVNVTMEISEDRIQTALGERRVFRASVVEGPDVIELTYSPELAGYVTIDWRDPDTGNAIETWRLLDTDFSLPWGGPVAWDEGDWWRFDARWGNVTGVVTLVHTGMREIVFEVSTLNVMVAEPVEFEDRLVATPFNQVDPRTMHPRSGAYSAILPKTYEFPLADGLTWSSFSGRTPIGAQATYDAEIPVANGTAYGFGVEVRTEEGQMAAYNYVPAVKWFTNLTVRNPTTFETIYEWRLQDFGSNYVGPLESPVRATVAEDSVGGSATDVTFEVDADQHIIDLELRFVQRQGNDEPSATLVGPDGRERVHLQAPTCRQTSCFTPDAQQVLAAEGEWTLELDAPGSSVIQYVVRTIRIDRIELDYS